MRTRLGGKQEGEATYEIEQVEHEGLGACRVRSGGRGVDGGCMVWVMGYGR